MGVIDEKEKYDKMSPFKQAANDGLVLGAYLSATFVAMVGSNANFLLSALSLVMILAMPVLMYYLMRRYYLKHNCEPNFLMVWNVGMYGLGFASVLCALVTYVWLQYVQPTFIYDQAQAALALYESLPEASDVASVLRLTIENGLLPTPIQFAVQMIMITLFVGMIISLVLTPIARMKKRK